MNDIIYLFIYAHIIAFCAVALIACYNLYNLFYQNDNFIQLHDKFKKITPFHHTLSSVVFYTGVLLIVLSASFNISVFIMILAFVFVLVSEIKRYKKIRIIKHNEVDKQDEFLEYAKKVYMLQLAVIFGTFLISYIF
jgi:TRAP-type C4-dicarboxylate transport system permease small subunit